MTRYTMNADIDSPWTVYGSYISLQISLSAFLTPLQYRCRKMLSHEKIDRQVLEPVDQLMTAMNP